VRNELRKKELHVLNGSIKYCFEKMYQDGQR
jgi:hypothetical protein